MIQLVFDAATPAQALDRILRWRSGYSQHSSAERAEWGDEKLELVDGTHPVVYPAAGSQANFYGSKLYLMRSNAEGVGCDDTSGPSRTIPLDVKVVPTARAPTTCASYPWLGFDGRWGEKQASFFNGPDRPERQDPVDEADHLVAGELEERELLRPRRAARWARGRPTSSAARRGRLGAC